MTLIDQVIKRLRECNGLGCNTEAYLTLTLQSRGSLLPDELRVFTDTWEFVQSLESPSDLEKTAELVKLWLARKHNDLRNAELL